MELGEVLRERRKAAGRTIASVAVDAGLSVPYIANLENGRGNPTVSALDRLATALGAQLEVEHLRRAAAAAAVGRRGPAGRVTPSRPGRRHACRRSVPPAYDDPPGLTETLDALAVALARPPTLADLGRLLDLLLLADQP